MTKVFLGRIQDLKKHLKGFGDKDTIWEDDGKIMARCEDSKSECFGDEIELWWSMDVKEDENEKD